MPDQLAEISRDRLVTNRRMAEAWRVICECLVRLDALQHMADDALDEINDAKVTA